MSIQKMYCSQSRKSLFATLGWSFFIKVSFCLYTSLIRLLLLWISSEASILLITEVAVETYIFSTFFIFGKISFAYFKFIYFGISKVISSMEGDEGVIFRKAIAWKSLFLLKIKSKTQTPQKRHHAIFTHIHQNIRAPGSKKNSALINDWEKVLAFWKESKQSKAFLCFVPDTVEGIWEAAQLRKILNIFFFLKSGNLIVYCVLLFLLQTFCTWKAILPIFQLFCEYLDLYSKR